MNAVSLDRTVKVYLAGIAMCGWCALILQFPLTVGLSRAKGISLLGATLTYLSFFTILTNLLVAFGITCYLCVPRSRIGGFFARTTVRSALAAYIATVGVVYSLLLRDVWNPEGLQKVADTLLHDVVPVLYVLYWIFFVSRSPLPWKSVLFWLAYPFAYLSYTLARGALSGWYPYPFIDVSSFGYSPVLRNALMLLVAFSALGLVMVAFSRWMGRRASGANAVPFSGGFDEKREESDLG